MMKEKAGPRVERQNSTGKKGFEKNEHACSVEGVFAVLDPSARLYLKVAGHTRKIQSLSKLLQVRKYKAEIPQVRKCNTEIPDTQMGLTDIGI